MKGDTIWWFGVLTIFAGVFVWDYGHVGLAVFLMILGLLEVAYPHIAAAKREHREGKSDE